MKFIFLFLIVIIFSLFVMQLMPLYDLHAQIEAGASRIVVERIDSFVFLGVILLGMIYVFLLFHFDSPILKNTVLAVAPFLAAVALIMVLQNQFATTLTKSYIGYLERLHSRAYVVCSTARNTSGPAQVQLASFADTLVLAPEELGCRGSNSQ